MTEKKTGVKWLSMTIVLAILLSLLLIVFYQITAFAQTQIPNITEYRKLNSAKGGITFEDINLYARKLSYDQFAGMAHTGQGVDQMGGTEIVLSTQSVSDVYQFKMITGSGFTKEMIEQGQPYIMISDQFALKRFFSYHVVGQTVEISGNQYKIIGVYETDQKFWGKFAGDGKDRVYLPYTAFPDTQATVVDSIAYTNSEEVKDFYYLFKTVADRKYSFYREYRYDLLNQECTQFFSMFFMFPILAASVGLFILGYKISKKNIKEVSVQKDTFYFDAFLRQKYKSLIRIILLPLALFGGSLALLFCIPYRPYVPSAFIPAEKIFDVQFYLDVLVNRAIIDHTQITIGNNFLYQLYQNTLGMSLFLLCVSLLIFALLVITAIKTWHVFVEEHR